jgi:hypothetical protein
VSQLTPATIFGNNLFEWWNPSGITQTNGNPQPTWQSEGQNAGLLTFPGGAQPTVVGSALNGYKGLSFNGTTNYGTVIGSASAGSYNFLHSTQGEIFYILKPTLTTASHRLFNNINNNGSSGAGFANVADISSGNPRYISQILATGTRVGSIVSLLSALPLLYTQSQWNVFQQRNDPTNSSGGQRQILTSNYVNDFFPATANTTVTAVNPDFDLMFGKRVTANDQYFLGEVVEILIINTLSNGAQRTELQTYFTNKYGGTFPIP